MKLVRHVHLALIVCILLPFAASALDDVKPARDQAHSLLNSFGVMCNLETPNFEHLSAKAVAMRMKVLEDTSETIPAGEIVQRKGWFGMLTTGPFALRIEKMTGSKGVVTSCAIEGPVPNMDAFREIVTEELHLTTPPEEKTSDGARVYYWDSRSGDAPTIIVRTMERPAGHFVQVKMVSTTKAETH
jgi:hypothetical protein